MEDLFYSLILGQKRASGRIVNVPQNGTSVPSWEMPPEKMAEYCSGAKSTVVNGYGNAQADVQVKGFQRGQCGSLW